MRGERVEKNGGGVEDGLEGGRDEEGCLSGLVHKICTRMLRR